MLEYELGMNNEFSRFLYYAGSPPKRCRFIATEFIVNESFLSTLIFASSLGVTDSLA